MHTSNIIKNVLSMVCLIFLFNLFLNHVLIREDFSKSETIGLFLILIILTIIVLKQLTKYIKWQKK
jgi:hypothetical protein